MSWSPPLRSQVSEDDYQFIRDVLDDAGMDIEDPFGDHATRLKIPDAIDKLDRLQTEHAQAVRVAEEAKSAFNYIAQTERMHVGKNLGKFARVNAHLIAEVLQGTRVKWGPERQLTEEAERRRRWTRSTWLWRGRAYDAEAKANEAEKYIELLESNLREMDDSICDLLSSLADDPRALYAENLLNRLRALVPLEDE